MPYPSLSRLRASIAAACAPAVVDHRIIAQFSILNWKVDSIMTTVADIQAALAANETKEAAIISLLQTEAQLQKDTLAQLTALQAAGTVDPAALQGIVDKMTADGASMDAAIASVSPPPPDAGASITGAASVGGAATIAGADTTTGA